MNKSLFRWGPALIVLLIFIIFAFSMSSNSSQSEVYLGSVVFILIGSVVFSQLKEAHLKKVCTELVTATITSVQEKKYWTRQGMKTGNYLNLTFQTPDGAAITVGRMLDSSESMRVGGGNPFVINDSIQLLYNPQKPKEFIFKD
jgi:hypothetical protein